MAHRGRILSSVVVAALLATISFLPGLEAGKEADEHLGRGPECDSAADCASSLLAQSDEGPSLPVDVAGVYRVTSTGVIMPGTEGALRVIEFTADAGKGEAAP